MKTSNNSGRTKSRKANWIFRVASQKTKLFLSQKKGLFLMPSYQVAEAEEQSEGARADNRENEKDKEKNKEAFRIIQSHTWNCRCVLRANARHYVCFVVEPHA